VAEGDSEERNADYKGEGSELFIWDSPTSTTSKNRKSLSKPNGRLTGITPAYWIWETGPLS
jgi:hypothetical protein